MIRVVMAHDRAEGLRRLGRALRHKWSREGMRPGYFLEQVLGGHRIQWADLCGPDAAEFVRGVATDPDPLIDEETRAEARRLLADRSGA